MSRFWGQSAELYVGVQYVDFWDDNAMTFLIKFEIAMRTEFRSKTGRIMHRTPTINSKISGLGEGS